MVKLLQYNMILVQFLFILFINLLQTTSSQTSEGSECLAGREDPGRCMNVFQCNHPRRKELPRCGFNGLTPLVCCPDRSSSRPPPGSSSGISVKKCQEYSSAVMMNVSTLLLTAEPIVITQLVSNCDYSNVHLIVGGEEVRVGEFPHMAALGYRNDTAEAAEGYQFNCGGSLISENFVLTAAHCTKTANFGDPKVARLGEHNLQRDDDDANPEEIAITEVFLHPEYRPPQKYNDIALLRLARSVRLTNHIRPACLPQEGPRSDSKAVATGWGRIQYVEEPSPTLLKVVLPLINETTCTQQHKNRLPSSQLPRGIDDELLICAGSLDDEKDTCFGDSGGPLSITKSKSECVHYVIGVTSFGSYCGTKLPAFYTRVSHYVPWIESIVWPRQ